jgi:hypothetical protein
MPTISQTLIDASSRTGTTDGTFRVDETGSATYSIPIATVPGTAGVAPKLSLEYSSGRRANTVVGYGWALSGMSAIARCRQTLSQDGQALPITWTATDRLCLDGQRLILIAGTYLSAGSVYKTEIDSFAEVTAFGGTAGNPDYFEVVRKDGSKTTYGRDPADASTDAKLNETGGKTYSWGQKRFKDSVGNSIWFVYTTDANGQRISEVRYAYGAAAGPTGHNARVTFTYATGRLDPISAYVAGTEFPTKMRLTGITSYNGATAVRQYNLTYLNVTSNLNKLSRLTSVQECSDTTNAICLPATNFTWAADYSGYSETASGFFNFTPADDRFVKAFKPGDVNGDGLLDFLWIEYDVDGSSVDHKLKYALSNGTPLLLAAFSNGALSINYNEGSSKKMVLAAIDYNLDGRTDAAVYNENSQAWKVYLAEPYGSTGTVAWRLRATPITIASGLTPADTGEFADLDSDGLMDLTKPTGSSSPTLRHLERDPGQPLSSPQAYRLSSPTAWSGFFSYPAGDLNSDGRADFFTRGTPATCAPPPFGCFPAFSGASTPQQGQPQDWPPIRVHAETGLPSWRDIRRSVSQDVRVRRYEGPANDPSRSDAIQVIAKLAAIALVALFAVACPTGDEVVPRASSPVGLERGYTPETLECPEHPGKRLDRVAGRVRPEGNMLFARCGVDGDAWVSRTGGPWERPTQSDSAVLAEIMEPQRLQKGN